MKKTQTTQEVQEPSIEKEVQEVQKNAPDQAAQTPAREYLRKKYTPEEMEQGHCAATAQKILEEIGIEKLQEIQRQAGEAAKMTDHTPDNPEYNPKTDPNNPLFDIEEWKKAVGIKDINELSEILATAVKTTQQSTTMAAEYAAAMTPGIIRSINTILQAVKSETFQTIKEEISSLMEMMRTNQELFDSIDRDIEEFEQLQPYIMAELEELQKDPQYSELTLDDILYSDEDDNQISTMGAQVIERAKHKREITNAAVEAMEDITEIEQAAEDLPRVMSNTVDSLKYPLDKINSNTWGGLIDTTELDGQLQLEFDTTGKKERKKGKEAIVFYRINFDDIEAQNSGITITKKLTLYDKMVYVALAALYEAGNQVISIAQIYKAMGWNGRPGPSDTRKINASLTKMGIARVYVDSTEETKLHKSYKAFKYDASLLPFERISAYINNQLCENAIHLFREPPLITFAKSRNQITSISRELLETPINKTDTSLRLEDYFIERICRMKKDKTASRKMLYVTIFERCAITSKKQKQRTKNTMKKILDHYTSKKFISGYSETSDGIIIEF